MTINSVVNMTVPSIPLVTKINHPSDEPKSLLANHLEQELFLDKMLQHLLLLLDDLFALVEVVLFQLCVFKSHRDLHAGWLQGALHALELALFLVLRNLLLHSHFLVLIKLKLLFVHYKPQVLDQRCCWVNAFLLLDY